MSRRAIIASLAFATTVAAHADARAALEPVRSGTHLGRPSRDYSVPRGPHEIFAREYPGRGPALVLLHGFPDNSHLYDSLVPRLRGRRIVTFDFLGWGRSDKPQRRDYTFAGQLADLDAVIQQLELDRVELVAHDAGVPSAVNWALLHPERTASLTLMNGFYDPAPSTRPPALIALLALGQLPPAFSVGVLPPGFASGLGPLGLELVRDPALFRAVFEWQERRFMSHRADIKRYTPLFARQFMGERSSRRPLRSLAADLVPAVAANAARVPALAQASFPLRLIWGARDPDLNVGIAEHLLEQVPRAELKVIANARHNLQIDEPRRLAQALLGGRLDVGAAATGRESKSRADPGAAPRALSGRAAARAPQISSRSNSTGVPRMRKIRRRSIGSSHAARGPGRWRCDRSPYPCADDLTPSLSSARH